MGKAGLRSSSTTAVTSPLNGIDKEQLGSGTDYPLPVGFDAPGERAQV